MTDIIKGIIKFRLRCLRRIQEIIKNINIYSFEEGFEFCEEETNLLKDINNNINSLLNTKIQKED